MTLSALALTGALAACSSDVDGDPAVPNEAPIGDPAVPGGDAEPGNDAEETEQD